MGILKREAYHGEDYSCWQLFPSGVDPQVAKHQKWILLQLHEPSTLRMSRAICAYTSADNTFHEVMESCSYNPLTLGKKIPAIFNCK